VPENPNLLLSAKESGEPPLCLAITVYFALKHAILAAAADRGHTDWFRLDLPCAVQRVREACLVDGAALTLRSARPMEGSCPDRDSRDVARGVKRTSPVRPRAPGAVAPARTSIDVTLKIVHEMSAGAGSGGPPSWSGGGTPQRVKIPRGAPAPREAQSHARHPGGHGAAPEGG
jgi:hypothetical protein